MPTRMSPARARGTRRQQLEDDVAAGASCADSTESWFREPGESNTSWEIRRKGLTLQCADCPVLAQCRELSLRYDTNLCRTDDMVRAGLTPREVADVHRSDQHRRSIRMAVDADEAPIRAAENADRERAEVNEAAIRLGNALITVKDHGSARWLRQNNEQVRALSGEYATRLAARRQRNGWTKEAVAA